MELTEAAQYIKDGGVIEITCGKYTYEVSSAENWVGDGYDGYISQALGNMVYNSQTEVIEKTIEYLTIGGEEVLIEAV